MSRLVGTKRAASIDDSQLTVVNILLSHSELNLQALIMIKRDSPLCVIPYILSREKIEKKFASETWEKLYTLFNE